MEAWIATLNDAGIGPGQVIAFESDFCDKTVALFLALITRACIAVPLGSATGEEKAQLLATAGAEVVVDGLADGTGAISRRVPACVIRSSRRWPRKAAPA